MREPDAEVGQLPRGYGTADRLEELLARAEESAIYAEVCASLADGVRSLRVSFGLSQGQLADLIGSSQPRVSMMESAHPSVSVSLMVRTLISLGARRADIARMLMA